MPDSTFPYGVCPHCHRQSNFTVAGSMPLRFDRGSYIFDRADGSGSPIPIDQVSTLFCQGCGQGVAVVEQQCVGGVPWRDDRPNGGGLQQWQGIHWWPTLGMNDADDPAVPARVASAVAEGTRSLAVRSPRAAAVMFRGALAEIVTDRGSQHAQAKRTLAAQLAQMADDHDLDRELAAWASEIRELGNAAAHPSPLEPVQVDDVAELARLLHGLLDYLYRYPARLQRRRATQTTP